MTGAMSKVIFCKLGSAGDDVTQRNGRQQDQQVEVQLDASAGQETKQQTAYDDKDGTNQNCPASPRLNSI
jgi:hypothetical protein